MKKLTTILVVMVVLFGTASAQAKGKKCVKQCAEAKGMAASASLDAEKADKKADEALEQSGEALNKANEAVGMNQAQADVQKNADTEIGKMHKNDIPTPTNDGVKCHEGEAMRKYASTGPGGKNEYLIECRPHQEAASSSEYDSAEARLRARRAAEAKGDGNIWLALAGGSAAWLVSTAAGAAIGLGIGGILAPSFVGVPDTTPDENGYLHARYSAGGANDGMLVGGGLGAIIGLGVATGVGVLLFNSGVGGE